MRILMKSVVSQKCICCAQFSANGLSALTGAQHLNFMEIFIWLNTTTIKIVFGQTYLLKFCMDIYKCRTISHIHQNHAPNVNNPKIKSISSTYHIQIHMVKRKQKVQLGMGCSIPLLESGNSQLVSTPKHRKTKIYYRQLLLYIQQ